MEYHIDAEGFVHKVKPPQYEVGPVIPVKRLFRLRYSPSEHISVDSIYSWYGVHLDYKKINARCSWCDCQTVYEELVDGIGYEKIPDQYKKLIPPNNRIFCFACGMQLEKNTRR